MPAGDFQVKIGASSRDIRLTTSFSTNPFVLFSDASISFGSIQLLTPQQNPNGIYNVTEGSFANITLWLTGPSQTVYVPVLIINGTASAGEYTIDPLCLSFIPNSSEYVTVTTVNDNIYKGDRYFNLSLQTPTNANAPIKTTMKVVIIDNDIPEVSVATNSHIIVHEGVSVVNILLKLSNPSVFNTSVSWTITGDPNIQDISFSNPFIIPPFVTNYNMPITVFQDNINEGDSETFILTIVSSSYSNINENANTVSFTVIDDESIPLLILL